MQTFCSLWPPASFPSHQPPAPPSLPSTLGVSSVSTTPSLTTPHPHCTPAVLPAAISVWSLPLSTHLHSIACNFPCSPVHPHHPSNHVYSPRGKMPLSERAGCMGSGKRGCLLYSYSISILPHTPNTAIVIYQGLGPTLTFLDFFSPLPLLIASVSAECLRGTGNAKRPKTHPDMDS